MMHTGQWHWVCDDATGQWYWVWEDDPVWEDDEDDDTPTGTLVMEFLHEVYLLVVDVLEFIAARVWAGLSPWLLP